MEDRITTHLRKHGPLDAGALRDIIDPDGDGQEFRSAMWSLLDRGALQIRQDWGLEVVRKKRNK